MKTPAIPPANSDRSGCKRINPTDIPVIDITSLRTQSLDQPTVAEALYKASTELGFIYVKGHGVDLARLQAARETALSFFRQPAEKKSSIKISRSHRGWLPVGQSKMHDDALPDLKESFVWAYASEQLTKNPDHPLRGDNQWPADLPQLEEACNFWFSSAHQVAFHLLRGIALGMNCSEHQFTGLAEHQDVRNFAETEPLSRASFVYYPPQSVSAKPRFGVGEHTDFGVLTVLYQDDVGGLQVKTANGEWIDAPPMADTFIVNVGDLLHRWTNGIYHSTPHRVINRSADERLSLVLAYDPSPDTLIDARQFLPSETDFLFEPITCGNYLQWRFGKAFTYKEKTLD